MVADEAQHVKNPRTSTARALRAIPSAARVALTGTPVENNLTELWAILDWATPGPARQPQRLPQGVGRRRSSPGMEPTKARQFADLIGPFLLRRRKSDPGIAPELPAKTETDHRLGLTREQVVLYESFVRDTMERIERADEDARRGLVLDAAHRAQADLQPPGALPQAVGGAALRALARRSTCSTSCSARCSPRTARCWSSRSTSRWRGCSRRTWRRAGVPHQFLHGGTPVREREAMVRRFQAGDEAPVFLLSLKAGGTGLNLTRADHVVHVDRWWNPAVEEQATDRAYRIGQTRPVQVHRMITRGTIEEKIAELLTRKRALADAVLASGEAALTELSNDELRDFVSPAPRAADDR